MVARRYLQNLQNEDTFLRGLLYVVLVSAILYFGRPLLIPLSFATLISFILYPVTSWLEHKGLRKLPAILLSLSLLFLLVGGILAILVQQIFMLLKEWPQIKLNLVASMDELSHYFSNYFAITKDQQRAWLNQIANQSAGDIILTIRQYISAYLVWAVLVILIPFFAALILYYRHLLFGALCHLFPSESKERIRKVLHQTVHTYYNFIKGMIIVYLVVGVMNSMGLLLLGVPHAILFGFTASILTFIPYLGIMVGSLMPVALTWIAYHSIWQTLGVIAVFAFVQYLEANVIFPLAVSNRLKINALATLVAIVVGGILWGVSGMILFVPFLAITKLISNYHPGMKFLSILTGTKSNI